jgi:hypothetical protein
VRLNLKAAKEKFFPFTFKQNLTASF